MESLKLKDEVAQGALKIEFDSEELRSFEQKSFENMIYFYRDELTQVLKGKNATEIFSTYTRRRFLKIGITRMYGSKIILTEKTRKLLGKIII